MMTCSPHGLSEIHDESGAARIVFLWSSGACGMPRAKTALRPGANIKNRIGIFSSYPDSAALASGTSVARFGWRLALNSDSGTFVFGLAAGLELQPQKPP